MQLWRGIKKKEQGLKSRETFKIKQGTIQSPTFWKKARPWRRTSCGWQHMLFQNPYAPFRSGAITDVNVADAVKNLDDLVFFSPEDVTSIIFYNYVKMVHVRDKGHSSTFLQSN